MTASTLTSAGRRSERLARFRADLLPHIDRLAWDRARLRAHQLHRLRALLRQAKLRSPFHAERLAEVDPDRVGLDDLAALPTMTKAEMMAAFDEVVTDPRLSRSLVEAHLAATATEPTELLGDYVVLASGGSSGERGVFVFDGHALVEYALGLTRTGLGRLLHLGAPPPGGFPMAMVAAGAAVHASRAGAALFTGDLLAITSVPVTLPLPEIVARLNHLQPLILQGYPSVLSLLAGEQAAGRLRIAPRSVTGSSEQFPADVRARVAATFGVGVADQLGATEGVVGVSAPDDPAIVLASDLAIVELVDDDNRPVPPGTASAKALVTNLFNLTQPLIRYELSDRFVGQPDADDHGHLRVTVEGRADDLLRYGGLVVHPLVVRSVLVSTPEAVEYQVRQTARGIDMAVIAPDGLDERSLAGRLTAALQGAGLASPDVSVRRVAALDRHPRTGKAKRFITSPC
jgi:phenylacetate-CoA ligase